MPCSTRVWLWQGQGGEGVSARSIELAEFNLWSLPRLLWAVASGRGHLSLCSGFSLMIPEVPHKLASFLRNRCDY